MSSYELFSPLMYVHISNYFFLLFNHFLGFFLFFFIALITLSFFPWTYSLFFLCSFSFLKIYSSLLIFSFIFSTRFFLLSMFLFILPHSISHSLFKIYEYRIQKCQKRNILLSWKVTRCKLNMCTKIPFHLSAGCLWFHFLTYQETKNNFYE